MYALILFSRETIGPWKIVLNKSQTNFIQHRLWPGVSSFSLRAILYTNSCGCLSKSVIVLELWPLRYFPPCSSYFLFLAVRENTKVNAFPASLQSVMRRLLQQTSWRSRIIFWYFRWWNCICSSNLSCNVYFVLCPAAEILWTTEAQKKFEFTETIHYSL